MRTPLVIAALFVGGVVLAQSILSKAESAAIEKVVAKLSAAERKEIATWPESKQLVEIVCKPAAIAELKKQFAKADRVFFGPDDDGVKAFKVDPAKSVSGAGSFRNGGDWHDMTFTCTFNPETAAVTSFTYKVTK